jgi:hypothetical protein
MRFKSGLSSRGLVGALLRLKAIDRLANNLGMGKHQLSN